MPVFDIATAFVGRMENTAAITSLVGDRIYPEDVKRADRTYPLIVFTKKLSPVTCFDGDAGIRDAILTVACVSSTYQGATDLAGAVEIAMIGGGPDSLPGWTNANVQGCFLQDDGITDEKVSDPTTEQILAFVRTLTFDVPFSN